MPSFAVISIQRSAASAILVWTLGGCGGTTHFLSSEPKPVEPNVYPENYKSELLDLMRTFLNDPTNVRDAYVTEPVLKPFDNQDLYIVCVRYNPKVDGKYVGVTNKVAIYYGGRINQFVDANPDRCGNAAYQPFPELEQLKRLGK
jgi:hypothetical protein